MKIILSKNKLKELIHSEKNLGFVPTMGAIHKGHISLVKKCISQCSKTIVSIFVNKPQFNKKSDFRKYPRLLKKDILVLKKLKVNYLYLPSVNQIYAKGQNRNIKISSVDILNQYKEYDKILFVPLAWNFYKEIRERIKNVRDNKNDMFLKYFPRVKLEN